MSTVEGGGYCEPNLDGPGSTKMYCYGKVVFIAMSHVTAGILHRSLYIKFIREALRASGDCGVRLDGSPNSTYN